MKYVSIFKSDKLVDLTNRVGVSVVDQILADNGLARIPSIGKKWFEICDEIIKSTPEVTANDKLKILNQFVDNYDIYEMAALSDENAWKMLAAKRTFPDYLYVANHIEGSIPDSYNVVGNNEPVPKTIYEAVIQELKTKGEVDPNIFITRYDRESGILSTRTESEATKNPMSWFKLPDDQITLYSSLSDDYVEIPVYPEGFADSRAANYTTMPDLIYQYEPWQMYQSSGPRSNSYVFHMHRDMWTGDHRDGKANQLIRFCQAQCYPKYNGSAVNAPTVSLYIAGSCVIRGVMNNVEVTWDGPIGLDGWYLEFTLRLSITEVSADVLNYDSMMSKSLIG